MNREWTDEELEILRRDRAARVPVPVIAAKLGRPVPATYLRARRIGSLVQPHRSWDEASVARLRELLAADPPMTDKHIAADLGRTVTQVRWKMKDLNLIGVRDLSKLARATSSKAAPAAPRSRQTLPVQPSKPRILSKVETSANAPRQPDLYTPLELALKRLESQLAMRLKSSIAEAEAGLVRAAKAAIAEKARIDQRLAKLGSRILQARAKVTAEARRNIENEAARPAPVRKPSPASVTSGAERPHMAASAFSSERASRKISQHDPQVGRTAGRSGEHASATRAATRVAPASPAPLPSSSAPKIVVSEAATPARPMIADSTPTQTSGRGGWKTVRRDPARVAAQARAKATKRADAVDLAQAAQAAIERFIAERGVTRTVTDTAQALTSRLQARGYIVVRDEHGWLIDQRHRVESEADLTAFAEARGISLGIAA